MAQYILKKTIVDAYYIEFSKPGSWPLGVRNNAKSSTGVSYGSMDEVTAPMGTGYVYVDGIAIKDNSWLVFNGGKLPFNMSESEFNSLFVLKS